MWRRVAHVGTGDSEELLVTANVPSSPMLFTMIMEAIRFSETLVFTGATRRQIPEEAILHSHCRENLKPYMPLLC
jgi:hypothetical protein